MTTTALRPILIPNATFAALVAHLDAERPANPEAAKAVRYAIADTLLHGQIGPEGVKGYARPTPIYLANERYYQLRGKLAQVIEPMVGPEAESRVTLALGDVADIWPEIVRAEAEQAA